MSAVVRDLNYNLMFRSMFRFNRFEAVADLPYCVDEDGAGGVGFDFIAQRCYEAVDTSRGDDTIISPDGI